MTTIAYDGRYIAADTQLTLDDTTKSFCRKINLIKENNWVWCCAGTLPEEVAVLDFLKGHSPSIEKKLKNFSAILVKEDGNIFWMDGSPHICPMIAPHWAIGSGWQIASAAMHLGLPAKAAVQVAGELDIYTNKHVDVYDTLTRELKLCRIPK